MTTSRILAEIDTEIARLKQLRFQLSETTAKGQEEAKKKALCGVPIRKKRR